MLHSPSVCVDLHIVTPLYVLLCERKLKWALLLFTWLAMLFLSYVVSRLFQLKSIHPPLKGLTFSLPHRIYGLLI